MGFNDFLKLHLFGSFLTGTTFNWYKKLLSWIMLLSNYGILFYALLCKRGGCDHHLSGLAGQASDQLKRRKECSLFCKGEKHIRMTVSEPVYVAIGRNKMRLILKKEFAAAFFVDFVTCLRSVSEYKDI